MTIDSRLHDDLATLAGEAGPLAVTADQIAGRVKRRRRALFGSSVLVVSLTAVLLPWALLPRGDRGPTPAAGPSYPRPFVCGEPFDAGPGAGDTQAGLTMRLDPVRPVSTATGPVLTSTITADRIVHVRSSPPTVFEVLYLRDGVIMGGGPMLNPPGDLTAQGLNLVGHGFDVAPGQDYVAELGARDRLCSGFSWPEVWTNPGRYEAVLVQGPVVTSSQSLILDIPTLGHWPLMISRARFPT